MLEAIELWKECRFRHVRLDCRINALTIKKGKARSTCAGGLGAAVNCNARLGGENHPRVTARHDPVFFVSGGREHRAVKTPRPPTPMHTRNRLSVAPLPDGPKPRTCRNSSQFAQWPRYNRCLRAPVTSVQLDGCWSLLATPNQLRID